MSKNLIQGSFAGSVSWSKITNLGHQFHQSSTFNNTGYWQEKQITSGDTSSSTAIEPVIWPAEGTTIKIAYINPITDTTNGDKPSGYFEDPSGGELFVESAKHLIHLVY